MTTVEELLDRAEEMIGASRNVDLWRASDARVNAEELLGDVIGHEITSDDLEKDVPRSHENAFFKKVDRRVAGEPVAMILGYTEFKGMKLIVEPGVFVPRNSSEFLADKAVSRIKRRKSPVAVDVATGTGPVALAIAKGVPSARVWGLDIWQPSLDVARRNARNLKLSNVTFTASDMLAGLPKQLKGTIDVFTIHPPYVARRYVRTLPKEIKGFEPAVSLSDNSDDGLGLVRLLTAGAPAWLRKDGWLIVEVSSDLSRRVRGLMIRNGFTDVRSEKDSLGATRVISGKI
ncbi:MAG TPA: HemK/PrmC family methyltransferase [Actinomycetota bacterium]|nr:HemK/PrmC family methyltransferase [Actinomycetota bacterium]